MIDAVIFDVDGVLLDSEPVYYAIERDMLLRRGHDLAWDAFIETLGQTTLQAWQGLVARFGIDEPASDLVAEERGVALERFRSVEAAPGVAEFIARLRTAGLRIAVASAGDSVLVDTKLDGLGLARFVEARACGDEVAHGKPAPDLALLAAGRLGVAPARCVLVEDTRFGLAAGRAAGMVTVFYDRFATAEPDPTLHDARWSDFRGRGPADFPGS